NEIIQKYESGMSTIDIGIEFNVSASAIGNILRKHGIQTRNFSFYSEKNRKTLPTQEFVDLYLSGYSTVEIAEIYEVQRSTVTRRLKEKDINLRKGNYLYFKKINFNKVEKPVVLRGRREYLHWRESIFKRDGYRCRCCEDGSGGNLNAHHIQNF